MTISATTPTVTTFTDDEFAQGHPEYRDKAGYVGCAECGIRAQALGPEGINDWGLLSQWLVEHEKAQGHHANPRSSK